MAGEATSSRHRDDAPISIGSRESSGDNIVHLQEDHEEAIKAAHGAIAAAEEEVARARAQQAAADSRVAGKFSST